MSDGPPTVVPWYTPGLLSSGRGSVPSFGSETSNQNGIRRTFAPFVRMTKPATSPAVTPAVAVSWNLPGTVTLGGSATVPSPDCTTVDAVHVPAPPPASVSVTPR